MKMSGRERKFIAAAATAAVVFALLEFVILPWSERRESGQERLLLAQKELRRRRELVAGGGQLRNQEGALRARLNEEERRLLAAPDVNQAGAQLQEWLVQQAAQQQLELVRSDFLPPSVAGQNYVRVPVQLELNGRITQLAQFFSATLGGERMVSLDELQIISPGAGKEKRVRCVVVISGLMIKRG